MASLKSLRRVARTAALAARRDICSRSLKPLYALLFITYRCTGRCQCCTTWKMVVDDKRAEIGIEQWQRIIDRLYHVGVRGVELFGGDALLRKDLVFDLLDFCTSRGISVDFPTNCNLIDDETAKSLGSSSLDTLYFSLDGTEAVHDLIRGASGSYGKVIAAIEKVAYNRRSSKKPSLVVNITISRLNYFDVVNLLNELGGLPIDSVLLGYLSEIPEEAIAASNIDGLGPRPFFTSAAGASHLLSQSQADEFIEITKHIWKIRRDFAYYVSMDNLVLLTHDNLVKGRFPMSRCLRCRIEPTISPYGEVNPCPFYLDYVLGNLNDTSFASIWGNRAHRDFLLNQRNNNIAVCQFCNSVLFKRGLYLTLRGYVKAVSM